MESENQNQHWVVCLICIDSIFPEAEPPAPKRATFPTAGSSPSSTGEDTSDHVYSTPCGHVFHRGCIVESLKATSKCPCGTSFGEQDLIRIYVPMLTKEQLKVIKFKRQKAEEEKKKLEGRNIRGLKRHLGNDKGELSEEPENWHTLKMLKPALITLMFSPKSVDVEDNISNKGNILNLEAHAMEERSNSDDSPKRLELLQKQRNALSGDVKRMPANKKVKVTTFKKAMASIKSSMILKNEDADEDKEDHVDNEGEGNYGKEYDVNEKIEEYDDGSDGGDDRSSFYK